MTHAHAIVDSGRIGTVVHTVGLGPHTLALDRRPRWFFDPARYGGILVDIGSHQVDQFLAFTDATDAAVVASRVRAHDDHPGVEVIGEVLLETGHATGYARVDYLTPAGLGAWGDVRFTVVGTAGYLEVRHVDQTVTVVDGERRETIDCTGGRRDLGRAGARRLAARDAGARVRGHPRLPRGAGARTTRPRARAGRPSRPGRRVDGSGLVRVALPDSTAPCRLRGAPVIACQCRAVDDRTVHAAVLSGASGVEEIGARCGAGTECGGCRPMLERLLSEYGARRGTAHAVVWAPCRAAHASSNSSTRC